MTSKIERTKATIFLGLIFWIGICFLIAWTGAQVSPGIAPSGWYDSLIKPSWNPPNWLFGPVWTFLYLCMGIAAWMVWKNVGFENGKTALTAFFIQLLLNGVWSQLFFRLQKPAWAFVEIFFLLAAILWTTYLFSQQNKKAAGLMIPYILWVAFAACLNGTIWWLNS